LVEAWQYAVNHPDVFLGALVTHIELSLIAVAFATVLGVGLGTYIASSGRGRTADTVLYLAEIMMTIPSLALFGLLIIILSAMNLTAIGFLPATIALIVYGQLPILRNTYIAIRGVDPALIEAGRGMGMTDRQLMVRVKLPLAVPVIMAGLRNSIILIIGIATIAALIGAGGLGSLIFRGLTNGRMDLIIIGGVGVAIFALLVDGLMSRVEHWVTPKGQRKKS
jgi:osmoprotectant transport system permease protein